MPMKKRRVEITIEKNEIYIRRAGRSIRPADEADRHETWHEDTDASDATSDRRLRERGENHPAPGPDDIPMQNDS